MGSSRSFPRRLSAAHVALAVVLSVGWECAPGGEAEQEPAARGALEGASSPPAGDPAAAPPGGLELLLEPSRDRVRLGEPVHLFVRLVNRSDRPTRFRGPLEVEYGFLTVLVRKPGLDEDAPYRPPVHREGRGIAPVTVPAGDSIAVIVQIYYGADGWSLNRAGDYVFRASYAGPEAELVSEPARLRVLPPRDDRERAAADRLMTAGRYLYLRGGDERGEAALRGVAAEYAGTPWGDHARLALLLGAHAAAGAELDPGVCAATVRPFRSLLPRIEDPYLAVEGHAALTTCLRESGRPGDARRAWEELVRVRPEAGAVPGFEERVAEAAPPPR